jgi:hypothetical protein
MKKERQIGIRVGLPAFFALEVEDVYRHTSGAHRALAFLDFLGLLIGLGLEEYRRTNGTKPEAPDIEDEPEEPPEESGRETDLRLFDLAPGSLSDLFNEFDRIVKPPEEKPQGFRLIHAGEAREGAQQC